MKIDPGFDATGAPCNPDHDKFEPPRAESTKGHGSRDNYIPHNCLGSQERLFMHPNFSYVALLRGYLDMINGQHLLDHTDHELCVTSGEHTKSNVDADYEDDLTDQSFAENLEDNDASTSAAGYQELGGMGVFMDGPQSYATHSPNLGEEDAMIAVRQQQDNVSNDETDGDPWRTTLFDDIQLDQVETNNAGGSGARHVA
ncbi:hypothetical protein ZWY2020_018504 [Hordeum vulgare]|nr:hypothetical protein ZWY2020_018504 [Hordeum vulgare]